MMGGIRSKILIATAAALLIVAVWQLLGTHGGASLEENIRQMRSGEPAEMAAAAERVRSGGAATVRRLIPRIDDPAEGTFVRGILRDIGEPSVGPLMEVLGSDVEYLRKLDARRSRDGEYETPLALWEDAPGRFRAAWETLAAIGPAAADGISAGLGDKRPAMRMCAARLLGSAGGARSVGALADAAQDGSAMVRWNAAWALGEIRDSEAVKALATFLDDADPEVRVSAVQALRQSGTDRRGENVLEEAALGRNVNAVDMTAFAGTELPGKLLGMLAGEPEDQRWRAALVLGAIKDPATTDALIREVEKGAGAWRWAAIQTLMDMKERRAGDAVAHAIGDPSVEVRRAAAYFFEVTGPHKPAVEPLLKAMVSDPDQQVRAIASHALYVQDKDAALEPLLKAARDQSARVRRYAVDALSWYADDRAYAAIRAAMAEQDRGVRRAAVAAIVRRPEIMSADDAMKGLASGDEAVMCAAIHALARSRDPRAFDTLMKILEGESSYMWHEDPVYEPVAAAALALGDLADARAVGPLIEALKRGARRFKTNTAMALSRYSDERIGGAMIDCILERTRLAPAGVPEYVICAVGSPDDIRRLESLYEGVEFAEVGRDRRTYIEVGSTRRSWLGVALWRHGDLAMAEDFFWSGDETLRTLARDWARRNGREKELEGSQDGEGRPRWGIRNANWMGMYVMQLKSPSPGFRVHALRSLAGMFLSAYGSESRDRAGLRAAKDVGLPPTKLLDLDDLHFKGIYGAREFREDGESFAKRPAENTAEELAAGVSAVKAALGDPDPQARGWAAEAVGALRDAGLLADLLPLTEDPDETVRVHAQRAVGQVKAPKARETLLKGISDPSAPVRAISAWCYGYGDYDDAEKVLTAMLDDADPLVRMNAACGLGIIRADGAIDKLAPMCASGDLRVKMGAARALAAMRSSKAIELVDKAAGMKTEPLMEEFDTYVRKGQEDMVDALVLALARDREGPMAQALYRCGHPRLREAAEVWHVLCPGRELYEPPWQREWPQWGKPAERAGK